MAAGSAHGTAWQDGASRALEYAIAASLALHALALLSFPSLPSLSMRPLPPEPPLEARLMPAQPVQVQAPAPPAPELEPAPPPKPRPVPRPGGPRTPRQPPARSRSRSSRPHQGARPVRTPEAAHD